MNPAIPMTSSQHTAPSEKLPAQAEYDERKEASGTPNPARTDDSPDAILGYN
jgi:hypothetical protein